MRVVGLQCICNIGLVFCRNRIVKEKGFAQIEHYCFEEHEHLRRAAVECICNLVVNEEVCPLLAIAV